MIKKKIEDFLKNTKGFNISLEIPKTFQNGDFSIPLFSLAKEKNVSVEVVSDRIRRELIKFPFVSKAIFLNGYLNIFLTDSARIEEAKKNLKIEKILKGKKILFEHTSPNPFKPLHIGHIMTNSIGESLSRIFKYLGAEVHSICYSGDVGVHIAKVIWAIRKNNLQIKDIDNKVLGAMYVYGSTAYENEAKAEIDQLNVLIYKVVEGIESDKDLKEIYEKGKDISLKEFNKFYKILGTKFDHTFFESETVPGALELIEKNKSIFEESEGALVYRGEKDGLHTRVFVTSRNTLTYDAKELGLDLLKLKKYKDYDYSYVISANEQKGFQDVVKAVWRKIDKKLASKKRTVFNGLLRLNSGKMSSRKGDIVDGMEFIDSVKKLIEPKLSKGVKEDISTDLAISVIKFSILKQESGKDIVFDPSKEVSFNGDTGMYILYTLVRMNSLLKNDSFFNRFNKNVFNEKELLHILSNFNDSVYNSFHKSSPHSVSQYLIRLCSYWNKWYESGKMMGSKEEKNKLALVRLTRQILLKGIDLLGIKEIERI